VELAHDTSIVRTIVHSIHLAQKETADPRPRLEVELDPPELGRVSIELTDTDRGISAKIIVHRPSTLALIEQRAEAIREALGHAGVAVHDFQVAYQGGNTNHQAFQPPHSIEAEDRQYAGARRPPIGSTAHSEGVGAPRHWPSGSVRIDLRV
jgi:flagellar hook-length control protein FliK